MVMAIFFMLGKYTPEARREISAKRTQQAIEAIKKLGGEVNSMHALLGPYDLLFCITLPAVEDAIKASLALSTLTGISFTTCPAVTVGAFDEMAHAAIL
jgi:uncharacterized protein with GYD domain